jgi:hypothetical protein
VTVNCAAAAAAEAAAAMLLVATDPADLTAVRRDYDRLARLAKANYWTDDTPVPAAVFGPLWRPGREPVWAADGQPPADGPAKATS